MKMKRSFFATVAAVTLAVLGPGILHSAAAGETDWIATDGALVNRLGGVHVYGTVSCAGTAQTLREAGSFVYQGEDGAEYLPGQMCIGPRVCNRKRQHVHDHDFAVIGALNGPAKGQVLRLESVVRFACGRRET